ncbi:MAG: hypothetical protein J4431_03455 [Candidatus Aenigmarchaeota archaeon]|nr:hypothetical protein [Candidatus Aenigmarchaeota archaeon]
MMNVKSAFMLLVALSSLVFMSGCVGNDSPVKTQEQASEAVDDIATDVEGLQNTLDDIDTDLG